MTAENVPPPEGPTAVSQLRDSLRRLTPASVRSVARRVRAEVRAAALDLVPLPLYETYKLKSLDPFVPRAATFSYRTSGKHFLILAGTPMSDSGGGQRPAQLALELLNRAHRVTYVYRFPSSERGRRRRSFAHENLTHARFRDFSARAFALERGLRERMVVLTAMPLAEFRACAAYLKARGAQTVYDCIDDWDSSLGGAWYSRRAENRLVEESDLVVASARALKDSLEARSWRDVALVPNAVNTHLFARGREQPRPADLPEADAVFMYVGALWGEWFDWEWIVALAQARPECAVVLVGEYRGQCKNPPRNVHFLGLRPQADVPAYLAHADVCLVPFKVDRLTRAVSPLKVFEYLAMGKPVVSADLPEVHDLPYVTLAHSAEQFVDAVGRAQVIRPVEEDLAKFVAENGWKARVRQLERLLGV
ncbi:MAG: glycosyltransferase [Myxococcales bacterium]